MTGGAVVVTAPAKLTLSLRIVGRRDDGYHLIDAEMVTVSLCDDLVVDPDGDGLDIDPAGTGLHVAAGVENTVTRALAQCGRTAAVHLVKRIPAGAGLGGGSADAAAVLRWAGFDDLESAAELGSDVPFCVRGGRARVTGIGEHVESLDFVAETYTLAIPPFGCSTPEVYAAWDSLGGPRGENGNDLEVAAVTVEPRLADHRDRLHAATGIRPLLAGSGSTWFVPGAFPGDGRIVVETLRPHSLV